MKKGLMSLAVMVAMSGAAFADCYSEGIRTGSVQKISAKGMVNKSWEGELVMEGTKIRGSAEGGIRGGNVWAFSVLDPAVAKVIENAAMTGGSVALKYCQANPLTKFATNFTTETTYRIVAAVERK